MLNKLRPRLEGFKLISANINNLDRTTVRKRAWQFDLLTECEAGASFPKSKDRPALIILNINFKIDGKPEENVVEEGAAEFAVHYRATFKVDASFTREQIDAAMTSDDELQYVLIAQAHALGMSHLRDLVQSCGFDPNDFSYGFS